MSLTTKYTAPMYLIATKTSAGDFKPSLFTNGDMCLYASLDEATAEAQFASTCTKGKDYHILHIIAETKVDGIKPKK